ncbi:MAG TPA: enoyl-CoA hydratase/isomerase family protein [Candidatus Angelobacter sp.]|nr:enoyl-CoA hydratase/isomerase family protein [Candidatus Angelobacter sp.]
MTQPRTLYTKKKGSIAELVLNRPEVLNAENRQLVNDFHRALDELEAAADLKAVIVTGAGRAFCSGIDLKELSAGQIKLDWFRRTDEAVRRLECLNALTIAKIRGYAIGGGLQIALACDFRVSTPDSHLGLPAVLEALIPGMGTYRLPRFIGLGRARRMVLTGELVDGSEALRIGLVDWVAADHDLDHKTQALAETALRGSSTVRGFAKKLVTSSFESDYDQAFAAYLDYQQQSLDSEDHRRTMMEYRQRKK